MIVFLIFSSEETNSDHTLSTLKSLQKPIRDLQTDHFYRNSLDIGLKRNKDGSSISLFVSTLKSLQKPMQHFQTDEIHSKNFI